MKGLTLYHLKSHLQKYRLGQQARKQTTIEQNTESKNSYAQYHIHSSGVGNNSPKQLVEGGDFPIAEAVRCQIEVQKTLHEQLEIQKKLHMRIEAQGLYLQAILEKAHKSLSLDMNSFRTLEPAKSQKTEYHLSRPNLMDNMLQQDIKVHIREKGNVLDDLNGKTTGSVFQLHSMKDEEDDEQKKEFKLTLDGSSLHLDLNTKGGNDRFPYCSR